MRHVVLYIKISVIYHKNLEFQILDVAFLILFSVLLRSYLFIIYYICVNAESKHSNISGDIHSFGLYFETLVSSSFRSS